MIQGPLIGIQAALANLTYVPMAGFAGQDYLVVNASDDNYITAPQV